MLGNRINKIKYCIVFVVCMLEHKANSLTSVINSNLSFSTD